MQTLHNPAMKRLKLSKILFVVGVPIFVIGVLLACVGFFGLKILYSDNDNSGGSAQNQPDYFQPLEEPHGDYDDDYDFGYAVGYYEGHNDSYNYGYFAGVDDGYEGLAQNPFTSAHQPEGDFGDDYGFDSGYALGYYEGYSDGYAKAYYDGYYEGSRARYYSSYDNGYKDGYNGVEPDDYYASEEYSDGYRAGHDARWRIEYNADLALTIMLIVGLCLFPGGSIVLTISIVHNLIYRQNCVTPGKLSDVMFIVDWVLHALTMLIIFVILLLLGQNMFKAGKKGLRKITIKQGKDTYVLTQAAEQGTEYKDQLGYLWNTADDGFTFERIATNAAAQNLQDLRYTSPDKKRLNDPDNKNLKKSFILFVVAAALLALGILMMLISAFLSDEASTALVIPGGILVSVSFIVFMVSSWFNLTYRKETGTPGALSTAMFVVTCVTLFPIVVIMFILALYSGVNIFAESEPNKIRIKDEDGNEYVLSQLFAGSDYYRDQYGDLWISENGINFRRATNKIKAKDKKGNEHNLHSTYSGFITDHYEDESGHEWVSTDRGQTFEQVVTEATVTDELGNKHNLRAIQSGSSLFLDENAEYWETSDGGKTFRYRGKW